MSIQFGEPGNTLSDDTCCRTSCNASCSPTLRLCFQELRHPDEDVGQNSECLLSSSRRNANQKLRVFGTDIPVVERYYTVIHLSCLHSLMLAICSAQQGGLQVHVRISHLEEGGTPDFEPPFTDPLIDEVILEFPELLPVSFDRRLDVPPKRTSVTGAFGQAEVTMQALVFCAPGFMGMACENLCTLPPNNSLTCTQGKSASSISLFPPSLSPSPPPTTFFMQCTIMRNMTSLQMARLLVQSLQMLTLLQHQLQARQITLCPP